MEVYMSLGMLGTICATYGGPDGIILPVNYEQILCAYWDELVLLRVSIF